MTTDALFMNNLEILTKVGCLAAGRAAVIDEGLNFLATHFADLWVVRCDELQRVFEMVTASFVFTACLAAEGVYSEDCDGQSCEMGRDDRRSEEDTLIWGNGGTCTSKMQVSTETRCGFFIDTSKAIRSQ